MTKQIPLSKGYYALVDDEDYDRVMNAGPWHYGARSYACHTTGHGSSATKVLLHRFILRYSGPLLVDHRNGDTLDCRKLNLRLATEEGNAQNRAANKEKSASKYKGVSWHKPNQKWVVFIRANRKQVYLGSFDALKEEDAARAYDRAALQYHGEFARLNFPEEV